MEYFLKLEGFVRLMKKDPSYQLPAALVGVGGLIVIALVVLYFRKYFTLIGKSLFRNLMRTALTSLVISVLVFVVTLVWSFLVVLDVIMAEKSKDFKAIVTERWQLPSQMPYAYAAELEQGAATDPTDTKPQDSMTWSFFGGTLDPKNNTF